jgi:phage baseplate assembly protein W
MATGTQQQELVRRRLLGWSPACEQTQPGLDVGRDLVLETDGDGNVDLARVQGVDNLGQSLTIALTTLLGSDVFNVDFGWDGLNALVEETVPILVRERVRVSVVKLLRKDPRVVRIIDVNLAGGGYEVPQPGSRELNVTVAFETVSQEQTTVNLGKVVFGG